MPEGHTLHRLALDLSRDLAGAKLSVSSPQGRFDGVKTLNGKKLIDATAVGKHLFLNFKSAVVHIHLGLFGRFKRHANPPPDARPATRLRLLGPEHAWDLSGPTRCEIADKAQLEALRARLGADPLDPKATPETAWAKMHATSRAIGAVLLDQSVISGIGNVYRAEILFLLGIHPETPSREITRAKFDDLWALAASLLARGVKERRIVTTPAVPGKRATKATALYVYKRDRCRNCGGPIRKFKLGARTMFACETCQPKPKETKTRRARQRDE